ncbi:MAG: ATP-dependent DNA helicase RecG [Caldilineaceae bacterium]
MSQSASERLLRVLELEEKQGWRNRAVVGGMHAMADRWRDDALADLEDEGKVERIIRLMDEFDRAEAEDRPNIASTIIRWLEDDSDLRAEYDGPAVVNDFEEELVAPDSVVAADIPPLQPTHIAEQRVQRLRESDEERAAKLKESPESLPGVGKVTAEQLSRLEIWTIEDLLWHLPFRYEDYSKLRTIAELNPGEYATVVANLWEVTERKVSMKRQMVQGVLGDGTGTLRATWWNKWIKSKLTVGSMLRLSGKVGLFMGQKTLENPVFEDVDEEMVSTGRIAPVYRLTEGITGNRMRSIVRTALTGYVDLVADPMPAAILSAYDLPDLSSALRQVHAPDDQTSLDNAWRRLAFEEFFYLQLGVMLRRRDIRSADATAVEGDPASIDRFLARLPYELTGAQMRVLQEIHRDMQRTVPMTRLVQGDVGSGKTVVAAAAMAAAFEAGMQSALLAPTQILAEQHYRSLSGLLAGTTRANGKTISVALLTGRVVGAERDRIVEGLDSGEVDVVVGTTALIQESVQFDNLGFVVVDEQHRFGVGQRGALRSKGLQPHLLVMSATPIPRSLALTVYGELDVSVIDEMPPGRQVVKTKRFAGSDRERLYRFMRKEVLEGRQGFIVYPLVEESENLDAGAAVDEYERLSREVFSDLRLGLLHGRMSGEEKDEVMSAFARGDYDVLVSTTVIEVGIDVPNASLMIVEDAERFGLAQLHQLRGRVGRGEYASYCALFSNAEGSESNERLHALEEMTSGFDLAEKDLELRGPGDFLGTRQSGLPSLRVAQLADMQTLVQAREAADSFLTNEDEGLVDYPLLAQAVKKFWRGDGDIS